jgi:hypothetical protein
MVSTGITGEVAMMARMLVPLMMAVLVMGVLG